MCIKKNLDFWQCEEINCVNLKVSIFYYHHGHEECYLHAESSWKEILDINFLYTEYGLQGSDFRTVGLSQF